MIKKTGWKSGIMGFSFLVADEDPILSIAPLDPPEGRR